MSITTQCMIVNLNIATWTGHRLDKEATAKVTTDANADTDAARVNKHLVPKEDLKAIQQAATQLRLHFYSHTLPWKDNGDRLLTRAMYTKYMATHNQLQETFDAAVRTFLDTQYPAARDRAAFRMGALFKADDYPAAEQLTRKFGITLSIDAVTEAGDFRVAMDQAQLDHIRGEIAEATQARLTRAMTDVWTRIHEVVGHFTDTMRTTDKVFRDSTVENLVELGELLPGLNVTGDPEIAEIATRIQQRLAGYHPKDLRKYPTMRKEAADEAQQIMDQMAGFMAAFTPAQGAV